MKIILVDAEEYIIVLSNGESYWYDSPQQAEINHIVLNQNNTDQTAEINKLLEDCKKYE